MRTLLLATIVAVRATAGGTGGGLPAGIETPSATQLLRAERMADEAARRLEVRRPKRGSWVPGGGGWDASPPSAADDGLPARRRVR
jgi:hypothetical protein